MQVNCLFLLSAMVCGRELLNIRSFTFIIITVNYDNDIFGGSDIEKHSYSYHTVCSLEHTDYHEHYETGGPLLTKMS